MTLTATYDDTLARVRLEATALPAGAEHVRFERSTDGVRWHVVRGGESVEVRSGTARLDDYEFAASAPNNYRSSVLGTRTVDTFTRTVTDGWGSADGGATWDTSLVDTSVFDVDGAAGTLAPATEGVTYWGALAQSLTDLDATVDVSFNEAPSATAAHAGIIAARFASVSDYYFAWVFLQDTVVQIAIGLAQGGSTSTMTVDQTTYDATVVTDFRVRFAVSGSTLQAKTWPASEAEPVGWQVETTDTTHTGAGLVGLGATRAAGSSSTLVATFDDLTVEHPAEPVIVATDTTTITPPMSTVWIKNIARPFLNRAVTVVGWSPVSRPARGGTFSVVGRTMPVAVTDVRGSRRYDLDLVFPDPAAADDFDTVLAAGDPVFVHVPSDPDCLVPRSMYAVAGDYEIDRRSARGRRRYVSLPLTEVAAPSPSIVGATVTWQSITAAFATWNDLLAAEDTWESVAERIGDADEVIVP